MWDRFSSWNNSVNMYRSSDRDNIWREFLCGIKIHPWRHNAFYSWTEKVAEQVISSSSIARKTSIEGLVARRRWQLDI